MNIERAALEAWQEFHKLEQMRSLQEDELLRKEVLATILGWYAELHSEQGSSSTLEKSK